MLLFLANKKHKFLYWKANIFSSKYKLIKKMES